MSLRLLLVLGAALQVAGFALPGPVVRRAGSQSLQRHSEVHCGAVRQVTTAQFEEEIQVRPSLTQSARTQHAQSLTVARTTRSGLLDADPGRRLRGVVRPLPADGTPARHCC